MALPLQDVRVLAIEQYGAGPFGTQYLVNLGAEVVKIEDPRTGGDVARSIGPHFLADAPATTQSTFFQALNHNKKSVTLNLQTDAGQRVFRRLAADANLVVTNLRGDVPGRLRLTYGDLKDANPKLVCAHLTAYGRDGERAAWPGYDYTMQAETGYFSLTGDPHAPPTRFGLSVVDFMTGLALAYAASAALYDAEKTGVGRDIDVNLFDTALYNLNYIALWHLNNGFTQGREPRSAHPVLTPCQLYKTEDGWIYVMCNKEKFWAILCERIGRPELAEDPRFLTFRKRLENRDLLTEILDEVMSGRSTDQWLALFDGIVPAAPILDVEEALDNPFVAETGRIQDVPVTPETATRILRNPIRCDDDLSLERPPVLGEHTRSELLAHGYGESQIGDLRRRNIV